ncbi:MAG: 3-keto-disaccharide hydrolase [Candidatus Hinthialibacter sp.]
MRKKRIVCLALLACAACASASFAGNWEFLFNGENLDGWKVLGSPEWKVEEGVIQVKGTGDEMGWLVADGTYSDFILRARFKWSGGNSGIQVRSRLDGGKMVGYQCNLDPGRPFATGSLIEEHGRGLLQEAEIAAEDNFKKDEWNTYEISIIGDHIITRVNGDLMIDYRDKEAAKDGLIALQMDPAPGAAMEWTDIRILKIPDQQDWTSLFNGKNLDGWKPFGDAVWTVKDKAIYGKYQNLKYGWLLSEKEYKDFHLSLQFKVPKGNSGIQFRSWAVESEKMVHGFQADLDSNSDWINGHLYDQSTGRNSLVKPSFNTQKIIDWDGWNTYEITAIGPMIELFINGVKTIEFNDPTRTKAGILAFQIHAGHEMETWWKDLRIIEF